MHVFRSLAIFSLFLSACSSQPIIAPVEQLQHPLVEQTSPSPSNEKVLAVQNKTVLYQCKKRKSVKVTQTASEKKNLTVEFNQTAHKLFSSLPKTSKKKYSNIRWIWTEEFDGSYTLRDKNSKILAEQCVKGEK